MGSKPKFMQAHGRQRRSAGNGPIFTKNRQRERSLRMMLQM
jgi:hypothetical protein